MEGGGVYAILPSVSPHSSRIAQTDFIVLDFETAGSLQAPVPIELAAVRLCANGTTRTVVDSCIRPPDLALMTPFVEQLTTLTVAHVQDAPDVSVVVAQLDAELRARPAILVAHHAPFDAPILWKQLDHCPELRRTSFVDTVLLARELLPWLPSHKLDSLIRHYGLQVDGTRHRALPDVVLTVQVLQRLLTRAELEGLTSMRSLRNVAGIENPAFPPEQVVVQTSLF